MFIYIYIYIQYIHKAFIYSSRAPCQRKKKEKKSFQPGFLKKLPLPRYSRPEPRPLPTYDRGEEDCTSKVPGITSCIYIYTAEKKKKKKTQTVGLEEEGSNIYRYQKGEGGGGGGNINVNIKINMGTKFQEETNRWTVVGWL